MAMYEGFREKMNDVDNGLGIPVVLDGDARLPEFAHAGDAGADLRSVERVVLHPLERKLVHTGVHVELPEDRLMWVTPRSGLAVKKGISIVNAPGLIDSGYRGEVCVCLVNLSDEIVVLEAGERIAQAVVQGFDAPCYHAVTVLSGSERGGDGFGSTGQK